MPPNADDSYRTVAERGDVRFTVRGSEFIGHVAPAESVETAEAFVERVENAYDDATHNVPAYRVHDGTLGDGLLREYSSDDGEPTGSAGKPVLNVLEGREVVNVVCVVTRYYGGTNLGIGGLVRAYGRAIKEAIDAVGVIERKPHERATVTVAYDDSGTVRTVIERESIEFDATYEEEVTFEVRVPITDTEAFYDRLRSATSGRVCIE